MSKPHSSDSSRSPWSEADGTQAGTRSFVRFVAEALTARAADLGRAWMLRGAAALQDPRESRPAETGPEHSYAEYLVGLLVVAAQGGRWHDQVMRAGWTAGTKAYWHGTPLYQLLKELDGGLTLLLDAAEEATREYRGEAGASDGLALARRLSDAASLLRLSAAGGYTRAMSDELRQRYRSIRHDLRNPLGTITSAVALMEDETVPEERRKDPRMRAMLARNARSMEATIAAALGDSAAQLPVIAVQSTSLRDLAHAVRGDLRAAAEGVNVIVADDLPTFPLDSAGLELLLKAIVIAIARRAEGTVDVAIELADLSPRAATVAVHAADRGVVPAPEDMAFVRELVARLGGRITVGDDARVLIEIPIAQLGRRATDRVVPRADPAPARGEPSPRKSRDDVAGEGERPDGESSRL